MSKEQAVIEIRNSAIKLLVGYLNDNEGKVNLLYNETIPLEEDILGAYITSKENVIKELSKIIHLKTNDGLKININEALYCINDLMFNLNALKYNLILNLHLLLLSLVFSY